MAREIPRAISAIVPPRGPSMGSFTLDAEALHLPTDVWTSGQPLIGVGLSS